LAGDRPDHGTIKGWPVIEWFLATMNPRRVFVGIYDDDAEFVRDLRALLERARLRATAN